MSELLSLLALEERKASPRFRVLGVAVDAVQISDVIAQIETWIASRSVSRFIAVTNMHGIMEAQHDAPFGRILIHRSC